MRGWIGYYGAFYRSELYSLAWRIDQHLLRWAMQKFKRLRGKIAKASAWLDTVRRHLPRLFAHWHLLAPPRSACGSRMTGDCHVRFCESRRVRFPPATHKHPDVKAWLETHPRFHLHFTPTSSSWLNLVERFFRELTDKALRRGVFLSVPDLIAKIEEYLNAHNAKGTTFIWTATADQILAKVARGRVALEKSINHETHH